MLEEDLAGCELTRRRVTMAVSLTSLILLRLLLLGSLSTTRNATAVKACIIEGAYGKVKRTEDDHR